MVCARNPGIAGDGFRRGHGYIGLIDSAGWPNAVGLGDIGAIGIAQGQKTTLKITADKQLMAKARTTPRVLMITNDPNKAKVVIKIK